MLADDKQTAGVPGSLSGAAPVPDKQTARLMPPPVKGVFAPLSFLTLVAIVGGAALFGDGLITPAISVLSAVEGLSILTPAATTWEVSVTIAILIGLFVIQSRGTEKVGIVFGPVMALWFAAIAVAGAVALPGHLRILTTFDPRHALGFITEHGLFGFLVLGATILCVGLTGLSTTWYEGRRRLARSLAEHAVPVEDFVAEVEAGEGGTLAGTAVFLTGNPTDIPYVLRHHWARTQALHERIVLLTIEPAPEPTVPAAERVTVERVHGDRLVRVRARFGFMELPALEPIASACKMSGLDFDDDRTSFVIASPQIVPKPRDAARGRMLAPRRWLFDVMQRLAGTHPASLRIPADRLVEVGVEVPL